MRKKGSSSGDFWKEHNGWKEHTGKAHMPGEATSGVGRGGRKDRQKRREMGTQGKGLVECTKRLFSLGAEETLQECEKEKRKEGAIRPSPRAGKVETNS